MILGDLSPIPVVFRDRVGAEKRAEIMHAAEVFSEGSFISVSVAVLDS